MLHRNFIVAAGLVLFAVASITGEQNAAQSGNINPLRLSPNHAGSARHQQAKGPLEQGWLHVVFNTPDLAAAYKYLAQKERI